MSPKGGEGGPPPPTSVVPSASVVQRDPSTDDHFARAWLSVAPMAVTPLSRRPKAAFAVLSVAFALLSISPPAHATTSIGSLDPAFGAGGRLTLSDRRQAMQFPPLVLPDGRFRLIEGVPGDGTALLGFLPDGSPDGGFGTGGVVTFAPAVHPRAMALDASGRIVLTGTTGTGTTVDEIILRRLSNGTADPSFGTSGRVK